MQQTNNELSPKSIKEFVTELQLQETAEQEINQIQLTSKCSNLIAPMLYMNMHYLFLAVLCFLDAFHNECYGIAVLFFIQVIDIFGSLAGPAKEIK